MLSSLGEEPIRLVKLKLKLPQHPPTHTHIKKLTFGTDRVNWRTFVGIKQDLPWFKTYQKNIENSDERKREKKGQSYGAAKVKI